MPKALCVFGLIVAGLLLLLFGADLALGVPFGVSGMAGYVMDIGMIVLAGLMGYLGWATLSEQK